MKIKWTEEERKNKSRKKERRKVVVEKGIWKIVVITENVDFGVCS